MSTAVTNFVTGGLALLSGMQPIWLFFGTVGAYYLARRAWRAISAAADRVVEGHVSAALDEHPTLAEADALWDDQAFWRQYDGLRRGEWSA